MKTLLVVLSMISVSALARIPDQKIHLSARGQQVVATIDQGYHFNVEAPAALQSMDGKISVAPTTKKEKNLVFDADKVQGQEFTVDFYVCDDAKTVCESHGGTYQIVAGELKTQGVDKALPGTAKPQAAPAPTVQNGVKFNAHGFIVDDLDAALKKAKAQHKKVLADFRAPWCPACIRLETEVFDQKNFQTATRDLIKVSLNVDLPANKPLAERYGAKAIPTLVLMDAGGNELYRSLDYKPAALLAGEIRAAVKNEKWTYEQLKKKAEAGDAKAALVLGRREFKALDYQEAFRWLSKTQEEGLMKASSEVGLWSAKSDQDEKQIPGYLEVLKRNANLFGDSYDAIQWRNEWAKKAGESKAAPADEIKNVVIVNVQKIDGLLESEKKRTAVFRENMIGDFTGFEKSELLSQKIESMKILAAGSEAPNVRELSVEIAALKLDVERPGEILMAQGYLDQVGDKAQIVSWLEKLIKADPNNYVYHRRLARFYLNEKDYAKALAPAQKSAELGTDLALQNLELLAKVQKGLSQKSEAQKTVQKALSLPEAKLEANQKAVKSLEDLKKTL